MYWCNRGENYQEREKRKKGIAQAKKGFFFRYFLGRFRKERTKSYLIKEKKGGGRCQQNNT
jgi:hypothetical protein